jgi:hypothetical protein
MKPRALPGLLLAAALTADPAACAPAQLPGSAAALAALDLLWSPAERDSYRARRPEQERQGLASYPRSNAIPDRARLEAMTIKAALLQNIPPDILLGLISHESQWQVNAVNINRNRSFDMGLGQLNNLTWEGHLKQHFPGKTPFDPWTNIQGAALFLRQVHDLMPPGPESERWRLALMSYNMGPRRILEACRYNRPPPEIGRRYAQRVLALSRRYKPGWRAA